MQIIQTIKHNVYLSITLNKRNVGDGSQLVGEIIVKYCNGPHMIFFNFMGGSKFGFKDGLDCL